MKKKLLTLLSLILICFNSLLAQFSTPTIDGTIGTNEYGTHTNGENQLTNGGLDYYITWDNTNLYVGVTGHDYFGNAVVLYIDADPTTPVNSANNADGSLSGTGFDGVTPSLPFRADFFAFVKDNFDSWIRDDGAGGWGSQNDNVLTKNFNDPNDIAEFSIPWDDITDNSGRPNSFNFVAFMSFSGGGGSGTFGNAPTANPSGLTPNLVRYFTVSSTADGSSTKPFSQESYTHIGGNINNFGALSVYDFTMNTNSATITRSTGQWTIANNFLVNDGSVDMGSLATSVDVSGDCTIESAGTLTLSTAIGGDLKVGGDFTLNGGTLTNNNRAIFFNGATDQAVTGTTDPITFDFAINQNTGGTVNFNQNVTISTDLTLEPSTTIDATSVTTTVNGTLDIQSDASSYAQFIGDVQGTGTVEIESNLDATGGPRWFNVASPFSGGTVADFAVSAGSIQTANGFTANQVNIYYYDPTTADNSVTPAEGTWTMVPNTTFSTDNNAFSLYLGGTFFGGNNNITLTATGSSLNDGAVTIPIEEDNQGWNFVPNPYPSSIDWEAYHDANPTDLASTYYIRNGGVWVSYTSNGSGIGSGANGGQREIAPMQGFFVQNTGAAQISLSLDNTFRTLNNAPPKFKGQGTQALLKLKATAVSSQSSDETVIFFDSQFKDSWEAGTDGEKRKNDALGVPNLYTADSQSNEYVFNKLNDSFQQKIVPMSFENDEAGIQKISISNNQLPGHWTVTLIDHLNDVTVDLERQNYQFSHTVGNIAERFSVVINKGPSVGIEEAQEITDIYAWLQGGTLNVNLEQLNGNAAVSLYNVNGQTMKQVHLDGGATHELNLAELSQGLYILKVASNGQTLHTQKIIK